MEIYRVPALLQTHQSESVYAVTYRLQSIDAYRVTLTNHVTEALQRGVDSERDSEIIDQPFWNVYFFL